MLAIAAIGAGDVEKALSYVERAEAERDPLFVLLARLWPEYDQLRGEVRFNRVVDRLHLPGSSRVSG